MLTECSDEMYDSIAYMTAMKCYGRNGGPDKDIYIEGMRIDQVESCILTDKWFCALIESVNNMKFGLVDGQFTNPLDYAHGQESMKQLLTENKQRILAREDSIYNNRKLFGYIVVVDFRVAREWERAIACIDKDLKEVLWVNHFRNMLLWIETIKYLRDELYIKHPIKYNEDNEDTYFGGARMPFARYKMVLKANI